ncbi:hypothetical protein V1523DRAFT_123614 [Lipomyces doorenjongii]
MGRDTGRAAFHAIKALYGVFIESEEDEGDKDGVNSSGGGVSGKRIHRSMIISHCMLVFWAYASSICILFEWPGVSYTSQREQPIEERILWPQTTSGRRPDKINTGFKRSSIS